MEEPEETPTRNRLRGILPPVAAVAVGLAVYLYLLSWALHGRAPFFAERSTSPTTVTSVVGAPGAATSTTRDVSPPLVTALTTEPTDVWEQGDGCPDRARTTTVSAHVTDATGVGVVGASWRVPDVDGTTSKAMKPSANRTYRATVGPFPAGTVSAPTTLSVRVVARDIAGNTIVLDAALTLHPTDDCSG